MLGYIIKGLYMYIAYRVFIDSESIGGHFNGEDGVSGCVGDYTCVYVVTVGFIKDFLSNGYGGVNWVKVISFKGED